MAYVFIKGQHFDISVVQDKDRSGLSKVARESFKDFASLEDNILHYNARIGKKKEDWPDNLVIHTIPFTISRLPVFYEHPAGNLLIGHVELVLGS